MRNFGYTHTPYKELLWPELKEHSNNYVLIAGGTNVMLNILDRKIDNKVLVDIRYMADLKGIVDNGDTITIGALTSIKELEESELIKKDAYCLWQAAKCFADPTTRNSATIGGNICNASPGADTAPPLLVLDAVVVLERVNGTRKVNIKDFFKGVGKNCLEPREIVNSIIIKKSLHSCFIKVGLRNAMAISVASVAVSFSQGGDGHPVSNPRVAMGSVAPTPKRCSNAEAALGEFAGEELYPALVNALAEDIKPIDDFRATGRYRAMIAPGLVQKALKSACSCNGGDK